MIDESFWTAVSIGRQVQNPLSELAKIAPHHLIAGTMSEEISPEKLKIAVETVIQECLHAPRKVQNTHRHQKEFHRPKPQKAPKTSVFNSAMADALAKLNIGATS
jgi:transcriptional accessory protein Tex/SPT6